MPPVLPTFRSETEEADKQSERAHFPSPILTAGQLSTNARGSSTLFDIGSTQVRYGCIKSLLRSNIFPYRKQPLLTLTGKDNEVMPEM